jgi:toxin FitB
VRGFLLDTNVVSELRRPAPDRSVRGFVAARLEDTLFVSEVTFAEIRFGIERQGDPERRGSLGQLDLFLAATAAENGLVAVSRDTVHFVAAGVPTLDPWTGAYADATGDMTIVSHLDSSDLLLRLERGA